MRRRLTAILALSACVLAAGCTATADAHLPPSNATPTPTPAVPPARPISLPQVWTPPLSPSDPYAAAIRTAVGLGLQVWVETDLVKSWEEGPGALATTLGRVEELAAIPGVVGVKVADELGYRDGFRYDASGMRTFLATVHYALHQADPTTKVLVDLLVPELSCAEGVSGVEVQSQLCMGRDEISNPALDLPEVDTVLRDHNIDVVDLSSDLLSPSIYAVWGIDATTAQKAAWAEVAQRGWFSIATINGRKALTHAGRFTGGAPYAQTLVSTYVDIPHEAGAPAVDIWTWHQVSSSAMVQLMDPGMQDNALWDALVAAHRSGIALLTHFTPTSTMVSVPADLAQIATAFTGVLIAAGTG